jgi:hypothetical protein
LHPQEVEFDPPNQAARPVGAAANNAVCAEPPFKYTSPGIIRINPVPETVNGIVEASGTNGLIAAVVVFAYTPFPASVAPVLGKMAPLDAIPSAPAAVV